MDGIGVEKIGPIDPSPHQSTRGLFMKKFEFGRRILFPKWGHLIIKRHFLIDIRRSVNIIRTWTKWDRSKKEKMGMWWKHEILLGSDVYGGSLSLNTKNCGMLKILENS